MPQPIETIFTGQLGTGKENVAFENQQCHTFKMAASAAILNLVSAQYKENA